MMTIQKSFAIAAVAALLSTCLVTYAQSPQPQPPAGVEVTVTPLPRSATIGITHLPLEVDIDLATQFVKIGFGPVFLGQKGFQSTLFRTPQLNTRQAATLIRLVPEYRSFKGEPVAAAVESLAGSVSGVEFGREGSPVLYINLPYWTHQREGPIDKPAGIRIPEDDHLRFVEELRRVFVGQLGAQEFGPDRIDGRSIRIWWR
jgi:hypothetical protein